MVRLNWSVCAGIRWEWRVSRKASLCLSSFVVLQVTLKGSHTGRQLSPFFPKKRVVLHIKKTPFPWFPEHVTSASTAPTALGAGQCTELTWPMRRWHHDGTPWREAPSWLPRPWNSWSGHADWGVQEELCLPRRRRRHPLTASWVGEREKVGGGALLVRTEDLVNSQPRNVSYVMGACVQS